MPTKVTINGGLNGQSYAISVPDGASADLVQQYAAQIDAAIAQKSYQVVAPRQDYPGPADVTQLDWDRSYTTLPVNVQPEVTNIYYHDTGTSTRDDVIAVVSDDDRTINISMPTAARRRSYAQEP